MPYSIAAVLVRAMEQPKFRRSELDYVPCNSAVDLRALEEDWEGMVWWQWARPQPQPGPSLPWGVPVPAPGRRFERRSAKRLTAGGEEVGTSAEASSSGSASPSIR